MQNSQPGRLSPLALAALLTGPFLTVMSAFSAIVAAPSIRKDLDGTTAQMSLIVSGYGVAYAASLITGGRLGDIFGRRKMFLIGLAGFSLASIGCAAATSMSLLVIWRLIQGLFAALTFPQVLSVIRIVEADETRRARAFAAFGVALGLSGVAGQVLSGALIEADLLGLSWRSVFLINVPVAVAAMAVVGGSLAESRSTTETRLDIPGALLCATVLTLLLYIVVRLADFGIFSHLGIVLAIAVVLALVFVTDQIRKSRAKAFPLIHINVFSAAGLVAGLAVASLFHTTVVAFPLVLATYLQLGPQFSAWSTGLMGLPTTLSFLLTSLVASRLITKPYLPLFMRIGGVVTATGMAACAVAVGLHLRHDVVLASALVILGVGQGVFLPPLLNAVMSGVALEYAGTASGLVATSQQLGGAFGAAAVNAIYFATIATLPGTNGASGHANAFVLASLVPTVAVLSAVVLLSRVFRRAASAS
jgi:MFS family permease